MSQGYKTKLINLDRVMRSRAFVMGFEDKRAGRAPREDHEIPRLSKGLSGVLSYERGRQFAAARPDVPAVKYGRDVWMPAYRAFAALTRDRTIL